MTSIELDELGPPAQLPLTAGEGRAAARRLAGRDRRPVAYQPHIWHVAAAGKVDTARIGDMTVHVRPKVPSPASCSCSATRPTA